MDSLLALLSLGKMKPEPGQMPDSFSELKKTRADFAIRLDPPNARRI